MEPAPNTPEPSDAERPSPWLHVVLHEPEIPPNTGNIGRTCVALGAKLWLVRPLGFRLDAPALRRAGMDYWSRLEWELVDCWQQLVERLGPSRMWFLTRHGERSYADVTYAAGDVLVFGGESRGLPESLRRQHADRLLCIPMRREARALNLSSAVAIVAYECHRQLADAR